MKIRLIGDAVAGRSLQVSAQNRLNVYADVVPGDGDKSRIVIYGTPGLASYVSGFGSRPIIGMYWWDRRRLLMIATDQRLYSVNESAAITDYGVWSAPGTPTYAIMADNGQDLTIAFGSAVAPQRFNGTTISTPTFPFAAAYSSAYLAGRMVLAGDRQFYWSDLYDAGTYQATSFAEAESYPDNLIRVYENNGVLILFGTQSLEFWGTADDPDLPFQRIVGPQESIGLYARNSIGTIGNTIFFVGRNAFGSASVYRMDGYSVATILPTELEYLLNTEYSNFSGATAFCYRQNGHDFYHIHWAGNSKPSWLYDATTAIWSYLGTDTAQHDAKYGEVTFFPGPGGTELNPEVIVSSASTNGTLYELSPTAYSNNGTAITRRLVIPHIYGGDSLNRLTIHRMRLDRGEDGPSPLLYASLNAGETWGTGMAGTTETDSPGLDWTALGQGRSWAFKLEASGTTGPIAWINAYLEASSGGK